MNRATEELALQELQAIVGLGGLRLEVPDEEPHVIVRIEPVDKGEKGLSALASDEAGCHQTQGRPTALLVHFQRWRTRDEQQPELPGQSVGVQAVR